MAKPQNPIIAQKKLEAMLNKNADKIKKMTEEKDFNTARIAFLAVINYNDTQNMNETIFDICEKFDEVYIKIKDLDNLDEIIKTCNDTLNWSRGSAVITKEDLETAWPKDFLTYSSM